MFIQDCFNSNFCEYYNLQMSYKAYRTYEGTITVGNSERTTTFYDMQTIVSTLAGKFNVVSSICYAALFLIALLGTTGLLPSSVVIGGAIGFTFLPCWLNYVRKEEGDKSRGYDLVVTCLFSLGAIFLSIELYNILTTTQLSLIMMGLVGGYVLAGSIAPRSYYLYKYTHPNPRLQQLHARLHAHHQN